MSLITLRQLEIFTQAVEHGSFRRCAEHIGMSQVAVSEHIRELERRLERRLFERRPGEAAKLTRAGEAVYRRARDILGEIDDLVRDFGGAAGRGARVVTVGTQAYIMQYFQQVIAEFEAARPAVSIKLDLETYTADTVIERLQAHAVDLAYFLCVDTPGKLESTLVTHEPMGVFVGEKHPLRDKQSVSVADLAAMPVLHLNPGNPLRDLTKQCLSQVGIVDPPVGLETDDFGLLLTSVRRNVGFLCTFQSLETLVAETSNLKRLPLVSPLPSIQVRQAIRPSLRHDELVQDLAGRLSDALLKYRVL